MTETQSTIEHLVVVRESDEYNLELMRGMILQTHHRYSDLPGHAQFIAAAEDPLLRPHAFRGVVERAGKTHSVLFEIDGTYCLYARGSAAKMDVDFDNGFGRILSKTIRDLRPKNIYLANFSRLVRRSEMAGGIKAAALQSRSTIHAHGVLLDMSNDAGTTMFDVMALVSSMDLQHTLMRLTIGRLGKFRDGRWILGPRAVPLGYQLDPQTKRVVLDPDAEPIVRELLELLADPTQSAKDIVKRLGRKHLSTPMQSGDGWSYRTTVVDDVVDDEDGDRGHVASDASPDDHELSSSKGKTIADLASPAQFTARILELLDFYETGTYHFKWASSLDNVDRYSEFLVHPATDTEPAHVALSYDLGLPAGGWAGPEVFESIRAVRSKLSACYPQASQARETQLALLGKLASWNDEDYEWQLLTQGNPPSYQLRRRPKQPVGIGKFGQPKPAGWIRGSVRDGELVSTVYAVDLHKAIFEAAAHAVATGVPARRVHDAPEYRSLLSRPERGLTTQERARDLRAKAQRAREQAERARKLLLRTTETGAFSDRLLEDAQRLDESASIAEAALAVLEAEKLQPAAVDTNGVTCEIDLLVQTLAALSKADGPTPRIVSTQLNRVFRNLRLHPTDLDVAWSVELQVPVDNGDILVLGPITGTVPQRSAAARINRAPAIARQLMTTERPVSDFGWSRSRDGQAERQRARHFLADQLHIDLRAASKALVCAVPETRSALWTLVDASHPYPTNVDPSFAQHVVTQLRRAGKGPIWYQDGGYRQDMVDYLQEHGGSAPYAEVAQHLGHQGAFEDALPDILQSTKPTVDLTSAPCPPDCRARRHTHRMISLKPCPHCGPGHVASVVLLVPECPTGVICAECRRMPTPQSPVFPQGYLALTPATAAARTQAAAPRSVIDRRVKTRKLLTIGSTAHMRNWARDKGMKIGNRGQIPADVRTAYWAAHPDQQATADPAVPRSGELDILATPSMPTGDVIEAYRPDPAKVRAWLRSEGLEVPDRGRLPKQLIRDYLRASFRDEVDPALVRAWARSVGMTMADSGPIPSDVLSVFLGLTTSNDLDAEKRQRRRAADIRKWAAARGIPVPARGRIPGYIADAYELAQDPRTA